MARPPISIIVVAKTDPSAGAKGTSLIVVETEETEGFARGAESSTRLGSTRKTRPSCFSTQARVPTANLLGPEEPARALCN